MKIEFKNYNFKSAPPKGLIDLLCRKYYKQKNLDYFLNDYMAAFAFCANNKNIHFEPIAVYLNGKMEAHIAIIKDCRRGFDEAFFGFFESPNNPAIFDLLWDELMVSAKKIGVALIKGPVNGSIWHQYRIIKQSNTPRFFKSEMMCEPYYYDLLKSKKPQSEINYYSAYRENFNAILNAGQSSYEKLTSANFSIQALENVSVENLRDIVSLSKKIFSKNWGFTDLSEKEFFRLYSAEKIKSHLNKLYLLLKGTEAVGFSNILREDDLTVIFKTIGVLPEYQGLGLGNALAFKVHLDAKKAGIKKIIYALVKEDNNIKNFPKDDALIFRRYGAFEFII